jgi:hypothetical protein
MQDLVSTLKQRIAESELGSEERVTLHSILGEYTRSSRLVDPNQFLSKWIRENDDQRRRFRRDPKEVARIDFETDILKSLLEE